MSSLSKIKTGKFLWLLVLVFGCSFWFLVACFGFCFHLNTALLVLVFVGAKNQNEQQKAKKSKWKPGFIKQERSNLFVSSQCALEIPLNRAHERHERRM